jgi:hypothetical protein
MREHDLKTWTPHWEDVQAGRKPFEIRRDDRGFQVGDVLNLQEFEPALGFTGRTCRRLVTFKLDGGQFGLEPGACALGLAELEEAPATVLRFPVRAPIDPDKEAAAIRQMERAGFMSADQAARELVTIAAGQATREGEAARG